METYKKVFVIGWNCIEEANLLHEGIEGYAVIRKKQIGFPPELCPVKSVFNTELEAEESRWSELVTKASSEMVQAHELRKLIDKKKKEIQSIVRD